MMRACDKATGKQVGAVWMPAPVSGSPMTFMWQGKQHIVNAVSGGNYSGEYGMSGCGHESRRRCCGRESRCRSVRRATTTRGWAENRRRRSLRTRGT